MPEIEQQLSATRADEAFRQIRAAIVRGDIPPGSKISEASLASQYGISRGPLREAIRRLEGSKLVQIQPNVGAKVVSLDIPQAIEIYEIRESLEGLACRLAAARATAEDCQALQQLLERHETQIRSDNWMSYHQQEGDLDFHYQIIQLSGNARLFELLCGELYHLLRLYRRQTGAQPSRPEQALKEHQQIVEAIANKDEELSELLMKRHIASAKKTLLDKLNQTLTE
jgi:DNA-binding GntR family transcriptional regulator